VEAQGLQLTLFSPNAQAGLTSAGAGEGRTIRPALHKDGRLLARAGRGADEVDDVRNEENHRSLRV
jgi:hypothetical protein